LRATIPKRLILLWFRALRLPNSLRLLWFRALRLQNAYKYCGFARYDSQIAYNYCGFALHCSKTLINTVGFLMVRPVSLLFHESYIDFLYAVDFVLVFITFGVSDGSEKLGTP